MTKDQALADGYSVPAFASSSMVDLELLIRPGTDLDGAFLGFDVDNNELLRVSGWLFVVELEDEGAAK